MKNQLSAVLLFFYASSMMAQDDVDSNMANINLKEDTTEITTVSDIIRTQQRLASRAAVTDHYAEVWGNRGFFSVSYNLKSTLTPNIPASGAEIYQTSVGKIPNFVADWGVSIILGKNIRLHKKPIANILAFYLDFVGVDINFNHFKPENGGVDIYDSDKNKRYHFVDPISGSTNDLYYLHWNAEKYMVNYGMMLGPSITIAPFNYVKNSQGLHFLKFNFFYHIGYQASFLYMKSETASDIQFTNLNNSTQPGSSKYQAALEALDKRNEGQFVIGHGLYHSWGISMMWKKIAFGYEHRWGELKYKNVVDKSEYVENWYNFDSATNRIYLTYRFGK